MLEVEAGSGLLMPGGGELGVANLSTVATGDIVNSQEVRTLANQLGQWVEQARQRVGDEPGMFNRQLYVSPKGPYDQMRIARHAVCEDDIVGLLADATEALAFDGGVKWESANPDDADVFNQLSADINLDRKLREMWRELFTVDQFVCVKLWDKREYVVRGKTENGNKKKKKYDVWVPVQLTLLKPEHVVPIGHGPLRRDELAWQATQHEIGIFRNNVHVNSGPAAGPEGVDPLMSVFFTGQYKPGPDEEQELSHWGVNTQRLLRMNPEWVFRHTTTRPDWCKQPDLRLRGVFGLLDLKRQLMASDRATLIGAANYILLIRKGSKEQPGTEAEIANLKQNYNFLAKLPVIISDHRLEIDVIAPKLDFVIKNDAYETLDSRILARTLATFSAPVSRPSDSGGSTFSDVLASGIQNLRHMMKRCLEREIARAVVEHPRNKDVFEERPSMVFTPRTVHVGTSSVIMQTLLALRTQREISRDTILEYMGLDQATEAQRLELEEKIYDEIFQTQIPFAAAGTGSTQAAPSNANTQGDSGAQPKGGVTSGASPAAKQAVSTKKAAPAKAPAKKATPNGTPESPSVSGARGGRPTGGGSSANSPAKTAKPRSANGNPQRRTT